MAVLITTQRGSFKVVPDDSTPFVYFVVNKQELIFKSTTEEAGELYITSHGTSPIATTSTDATGDGVTLATSAAVTTWITSNR